MKVDICILCLKTFDTFSTQQSENCGISLLTKFLKFVENFLQISNSATKQLFNPGESGNDVFCEKCELAVVNPICQLYSQLLSIQLRLSWELEQLAKLLKNSQTSVPENLELLGGQLGVSTSVSDVTNFRQLLMETCGQKGRKYLPFAVVIREEYPSYQPPSDDNDDEKMEEASNSSEQERDQDSDSNDWCPSTSSSYNAPEGDIKEETIEMENTISDEIDLESKYDEILKTVEAASDKEQHVKNHEFGGLRFHCYFCWKSFHKATRLEVHLKAVHVNKRRPTNFSAFPCELVSCKIGFNSCVELNSHLKSHSGEINMCDVCGLGFLDSNLLQLHKIKHIKPVKVGSGEKMRNRFVCPELGCEFGFLTVARLQDHFNAQHGVSLRLFRCSKCSHTTTSSKALGSHQFRMHSKGTTVTRGNFPCPTCAKNFPTRRGMMQHQKVNHSEKRYRCEVCSKLFRRKAGLIKHHSALHDPTPNVCAQCGKTYASLPYLNDHMARCHPEVGPEAKLICSYCPERFRVKYLLEKHLVKVHPDAPENLSCSTCGLKMENGRKGHMEEHELTHKSVEERRLGGNLHMCHVCGKEFLSRDSYKRHLATHQQTNEKA